jgi:ribonuclease J
MIHMTRPDYFIPIHGEYRHLFQHLDLAREVGVSPEKALFAENGEVFVIDSRGMSREGSVESGRVYVDGKGVGDVGDTVLRHRQHLSEDGVVVALVVLDKANGEIISGPELFSRGFLFEGEAAPLMTEARQVLLSALAELRHATEGEPAEDLEAGVRRFLKAHFWRALRRRPMIMPLIVEL